MAQEPPDSPWSTITTSSSSISATPPTPLTSVPKKAATPPATQERIPTRPVWISEEGAERPELRAIVEADRQRRLEEDTQRRVAMCLTKAKAKATLTPFQRLDADRTDGADDPGARRPSWPCSSAEHEVPLAPPCGHRQAPGTDGSVIVGLADAP